MKMQRDKFYDGLAHPLRGKIFETEKVVDIKEFEINSPKDNKFISSDENDMILTIDDFMYLIVPGNIFKSIIEKIYNKGFQEGHHSK